MNLINPNDVRTYVAALVRHEHRDNHIGRWYKSTFVRWLMAQKKYQVRIIDEAETRSPTFIMLQALIEKLGIENPLGKFESTTASQLTDSWHQEALKMNSLTRWIQPSDEESNAFAHWQEFMETLPARQIRHTVRDMRNAVAEYDAKAKRMQIAATTDGVEFLPFEFMDPALYIVRLESQGSFARESQLMDHCVGRSSRYYRNRGTNPIFSLRTTSKESPLSLTRIDRPAELTDETPLATFEVDLNLNHVVQMRGYLDRVVSAPIREALTDFLKENGWKMLSKALDPEDGDEDDEEWDEDDCDENEVMDD